jgi:hypothetical protein
LLAYTTLLAVFSAATTGYQPGRWTLYGLSLVACAASVIGTYLTKRNYTFADVPADKSRQLRHQFRHLPWLPTVTAVAAMAVYGLTIPGSALQQHWPRSRQSLTLDRSWRDVAASVPSWCSPTGSPSKMQA